MHSTSKRNLYLKSLGTNSGNNMNERIKELAEQASHQSPDGYPVTIPYSKDFAEKFAELIVKECMDIASEVRGEPATDTHYVIGYDRACEKMIDGIKEHFGVEERAIPILSDDEEALLSGITSSKLFTIEAAKKAFGVKE